MSIKSMIEINWATRIAYTVQYSIVEQDIEAIYCVVRQWIQTVDNEMIVMGMDYFIVSIIWTMLRMDIKIE